MDRESLGFGMKPQGAPELADVFQDTGSDGPVWIAA